jgi:hypothetical protein
MNAMPPGKEEEEAKDNRPYARTLLDTYMDGDLNYKNTNEISHLDARCSFKKSDYRKAVLIHTL